MADATLQAADHRYVSFPERQLASVAKKAKLTRRLPPSPFASVAHIGAQQLDLPGNIITIAREIGPVFLIDGTGCL